MKYNPVGWFEIPMTDVDRAKKFYEAVFEIELKNQPFAGYEMLWFPSDENAKGIPGALMKGTGYIPSVQGAFVYFTAPDLNATLQRVTQNGGTIAVPKKAIGEYGFIAIVVDSEGNSIGLHTRKE